MSLNLNISPQLEARFTAAARQNGIDLETFFEKIVSAHLPPVEVSENQELGDFGGRTLGEVFGHLFGTVKSGASDKATHPEKYMQGFGETKTPRTLAQ
jgi:hypothetical protein